MNKVLTHDELDALLCVPTTVTEAEEIKERFVLLLDGLDVISRELKSIPEIHGVAAAGKELSRFNILKGCPHCIFGPNEGSEFGRYRCSECRYNLDGAAIDTKCCVFDFGGVSHRSLDHQVWVALGYETASIYPREVCKGDDLHPWFVALHKSQLFCRGHIEWAEEIISRGGVV